MNQKTPRVPRTWPRALIGLLVVATDLCADQSVGIRIRTGDIDALAVGDRAKASINLGGIPTGGPKSGCAEIKLEYGSIRKIAAGPHATATVNIPEISFDCEEQSP